MPLLNRNLRFLRKKEIVETARLDETEEEPIQSNMNGAAVLGRAREVIDFFGFSGLYYFWVAFSERMSKKICLWKFQHLSFALLKDETDFLRAIRQLNIEGSIKLVSLGGHKKEEKTICRIHKSFVNT